ncbi:disintegrin and metalloproteinase domain-containing protein 9-like isoform X2 [Rhinatrema bivittatum]|uniref:disintegrin and metalloproteinase domain-containing protein 9-like isoform X2 n=1 Tax=Rhinatrema bivittatum TaxID=194408 RepID=UPI00112A0649|nr:disintegrin and metalloproteinase domain-containing protein 9-like isoform X2 [Rhinatrema bivittatum]
MTRLKGSFKKEHRCAHSVMLTYIILNVYLITTAVSKPEFTERLFEITIPQKIETNLSKDQMYENHISYVINMEGKERIIHLKKQTFLSSDFRVNTYSGLGTLRSYLPNIETTCFYQGVIADIPNSFVTLRTCSGLRGLLQLMNASYIIKPLESSSSFQHLIYKVKTKFSEEEVSELQDLDPEDEQIKPQKSITYIEIQRAKGSVLGLPRFLELYLILSRGMFQVMGQDTNGITTKIVQMISYLNAMYTPFNLHIILRGLEIWTSQDKVSTEGSMDDMLIRFIKWKEQSLIPRQKHDIAYLIISRTDVKSAGTTTFGKVCSDSSGAIIVYAPSRTIETFTPIFAHFLAHNLGIHHDDAKMCPCASSICIMDTRVIETDTKSFSNCSIEYYKEFLWREGASCLLDLPMLREPYRQSYCGDGVVASGEECDCGAQKDCPCCNSATCTFKKGAACATGDCCLHCQFAPQGTVCRNIMRECDLPEYCNGTSTTCPSDFYIQNGYPCSLEEHYCYNGFCLTHNTQCQNLLGPASKACDLDNFIEINTQNDRFGNCGFDKGRYLPCIDNDIFCGKLICEYTKWVPLVDIQGDVIYSKLKNRICVSINVKKDEQAADPFYVTDGITCDKGKVCNNLGSCHCLKGWTPPDCKERGAGGSIDSGRMAEYHDEDLLVSNEDEDSWKMWILIAFSIFTPLLSLVAIFVMSWKKSNTTEEIQYSERSKSSSQLEAVSASSHVQYPDDPV